MLQFRIANKIFALQPCGRCATGFLQSLPFVELWTSLHIFCPYMCQYMVSNSVKYCQMTLACERLSGTRGGMVGYSCYLSFDFESGFSFQDLLSLHWIGSTLVIDQNRSSDPKSCDYRYLSIILTNRLISIEKYRVISIYRLPFRSSILIDLLRPTIDQQNTKDMSVTWHVYFTSSLFAVFKPLKSVCSLKMVPFLDYR